LPCYVIHFEEIERLNLMVAEAWREWKENKESDEGKTEKDTERVVKESAEDGTEDVITTS
jgi:hypothetical protein